MDRERLDDWCEKGILGLVLAILVFGPVAYGAARIQEFLVLQWLTAGVLILWSVRLWSNPSRRLLWPPICWAVIAFVAYALIRYLTADIEYVARGEMIRILVYAFLFFAIVNNLSRKQSSHALVMTLVALATVISLMAVYQFIRHSDHIWGIPKPATYFNRASGTYVCPNHLAGFLEMILPLGVAFTLMGRLGHLTKVVLGYGTLVMLVGIGVSVSRGAWIALGLALAVFFATLVSQRLYRLPALAFLLVLLAAVLGFVAQNRLTQKRFLSMFTAGKLEDTRFQLWRPAIQMWQDHFWWGVGPAHFDSRFRQYRPPTLQMRPGWAHNDYLNTLADWGTAGGALVLGALVLLGVGVKQTWKSVRHGSGDFSSGRSNRLALLLGAATGFVAILLHSVVDFNMQIPANAITAITLMALMTGQWRHATERFWIKPGRIAKLAVTLICVAGALYLGQQALIQGREQALLRRARGVDIPLAEQIDLLKRAYAIEPMNSETAYGVGEALRLQSWEGNDDYAALAGEALKWFEHAIILNPFDPYPPMRYGMCLDWLDRHGQAAAYFERSRKADPNNYHVLAHLGWHYVQSGDYATARQWFERSLKIKPWDNPIAESYLAILNRRSGELPARDK